MDVNHRQTTRLLVGLDGTPQSEAVLDLVKLVARALDSEITLLYVLEERAPEKVHGEPHLTTVAEARTYLERLANSLRAEGFAVVIHAHADPEHDVAASIAAHAEELRASMVILGAHGPGSIRDWLVGRIAEQVLARAGCPVLVVPERTTSQRETIECIVLPIDQAGEAEAALPLARALAASLPAQIVLVTVVPTRTTLPGDAGVASVFLPQTTNTLLDLAVEQARSSLESLGASLTQHRIDVIVDVRRGDPARVILQALNDYEADLVILATHARSGISGLWAGSVTPRVVAGAKCPAVLVPIRNQTSGS